MLHTIVISLVTNLAWASADGVLEIKCRFLMALRSSNSLSKVCLFNFLAFHPFAYFHAEYDSSLFIFLFCVIPHFM